LCDPFSFLSFFPFFFGEPHPFLYSIFALHLSRLKAHNHDIISSYRTFFSPPSYIFSILTVRTQGSPRHDSHVPIIASPLFPFCPSFEWTSYIFSRPLSQFSFFLLVWNACGSLALRLALDHDLTILDTHASFYSHSSSILTFILMRCHIFIL